MLGLICLNKWSMSLFYRESKSLEEGCPVQEIIFYNWSKVDLPKLITKIPGNNGSLVNI